MVLFRQYYLGCLSHASYLVGDEASGRAVVVDPQRDVSQYLADAEAAGVQIERVIETHLHADFLSGHLELAAATGAAISYGPDADTDFPTEVLHDGDHVSLGGVDLEVLHTPGHTPESISIVIRERDDSAPWGVLTGDTLFIGDVGRPDLLTATGWTADALARELYRSLHGKLLRLPDDTRVFPAHGAGSACGRNLSTATESTIGEQRRTNYAVQDMSEDAFVEAVTQNQSVAPLYFAFSADANRRSHALLDEQDPPPALTVDEVLARHAAGAAIVDARPPDVFASGHLRGAINVGLDGRFAEYVGDVVRAGREVVLITEPGHETEGRVRLGRIGFDSVIGHLPEVERVLAERPELAAVAMRASATDAAAWRDEVDAQVVDVRNPGETEAGTVPGARLLPLATLADRIGELDPERATLVYCAGGYRSSIAAAVLRAAGFDPVVEILGGYAAWEGAGLAVARA